jgi:hypothetical protein
MVKLAAGQEEIESILREPGSRLLTEDGSRLQGLLETAHDDMMKYGP